MILFWKLIITQNGFSHAYSTNAASGILINDIIAIMESSATTGIIVNPIDDNIFQWQVLLKDFKEELAEDLKSVKDSYDYDHIELQLDFSMVIFPLYPYLFRF